MKKFFLTSESVTMGHPDKVCDYIADSILDACLLQDKNSKVAVEVMLSNNKVVIAGQITSNAKLNIEQIVKEKLKEVDYTDASLNMDYATCIVDINITKQSSNIEAGVNKGGAGDQGIMFGYATDETKNYMPYPINLAHIISMKLDNLRKTKEIPYLLSDGKVQVTVEYEDERPIRIDNILISIQHTSQIEMEQLRKDIINKLILQMNVDNMIDENTKYYINPNGKFIIGGPLADTGLTGRKIIVDTYGGAAKHGGGAFSGKDATKVDRSGAYMLRHIAKNIVANGLAKKCEIQISYGIGMREPLSIYINCFGTNIIAEDKIVQKVKDRFDLTPNGIIDYLQLKKPIYAETSNYGHFGREEFEWEKIIQF